MIILYSVIAIGLMGAACGCVLAYAAKRFNVVIDPRLELVINTLPGSNCGACGYPGCSELAKAVLAGRAPVNSCIPGGQETAAAVSQVLGRPHDAGGFIKKTAVVKCRGGKGRAKERFEYKGVRSCRAAILVAGGHKACVYGCLGLADCVSVCAFDAIHMGEDGIPVVDRDKCTACGRCAAECPRGIIEIVPKEQSVVLACVSKDKMRKVRDVCSVGCITCGICVKPGISAPGAITMGNNLPEIHFKKGQDIKAALENAVKKCPNKCFVIYNDASSGEE